MEQARAINETTSLITKLDNLLAAVNDLDRLRLEGARFMDESDESFQEYAADMDGIRMMAEGPAGQALESQMRDPGPLKRLRCLGMPGNDCEITRTDLETICDALVGALTKAQGRLRKLIEGD